MLKTITNILYRTAAWVSFFVVLTWGWNHITDTHSTRIPTCSKVLVIMDNHAHCVNAKILPAK